MRVSVAALGAATLLYAGDRVPSYADPIAAASCADAGVCVFVIGFYSEYRPETALDLVFRTPGFSLDSGDHGRGLSGSSGNVLINGVRPPQRGSSIYTRLSSIRVEEVERIELIEAGARDVDMQGYPVLLNVVTASQTRRNINARWIMQSEDNGGSYTSIDAGASRVSEGFELRGNINWSGRDQLQFGDFWSVTPSSPEPRLSGDTDTVMQFGGVSGTAVLSLPRDSRLTVSATYNDNLFEASPHLAELAVDEVRSLHGFDSSQLSVSAELALPLNKRLDLDVVYALKDNSSTSQSSLFEAGGFNTSQSVSETGEQAVRSNLRWRPREGLALETGISWAFNDLVGRSSASIDGVPQDIDGSSAVVEETRTAALASLSWSPNEQLTLEAGGRVERFSLTSSSAPGQEFVLTDPVPRFVASYTFSNDWVMRWRSELEVGQLSLGRFLASTDLAREINTSGATLLEPERTQVHEMTLERRFGERGLFRLQAEYKQVENPISTILQPDDTLRPQNIDPEDIWTLSGELEAELDRFGLTDAVLEVEARISDSSRIDPHGLFVRNVSGHQDYRWEVDFRQDISGLDMIWGFSVRDGAPATHYWLTQIHERDPWRSKGIWLEWRPRESWRGGLNVDWSYPQSNFSWVYPDIRRPGLAPALTSRIERDGDAQVSVWVEREVRDGIKLNLSLRTGHGRNLRNEVVDLASGETYTASHFNDPVPVISFSLRMNR